MSLATTLYLIDLLSKFGDLVLILWTGGIGLFLLLFVGAKNDPNISILKVKKFGILVVCVMMVSFLIPSERTMYLMASSHYIGKSDIPEKVLKVLNEKLDEVLNNRKENNNE